MAGREYVSRFSLTVDPEEQRRRGAIAQGIVQNELQVATDAGDARSADYLQQELRNRFSGKTGVTPTFSEATPVEPAQSPQPSGRWEVVDAGWEKRSTTTKSTDRWEDVSSQFMYAGPQAAQPSPDNSFMGSVARGLKKTIPELKQAGAGVVAYLGDVLGSDGMREWGLDKYQKIEAETKPLQSENDSFNKVFLDGEGSKTAWLGNAVGYTLGQVGTALVSGGIGAIGGKFIAKKAITEGVERAIATRLEQELAAGAARDVAEQAALKAGQEYAAGAIAQSVKTGSITGAFTHNVTQELGSIYNDAVEQAKKDGRSRLDGGDLFRIGASALVAAGVDTAAEAVNFGKVFKGGVGETIGARAAREIPAGMVREGATEAVQTGIEQYGAAKPFDWREIIDAAALGAVGGGMAGGAASLRQAPTASQVPIDQAADAPITPVVTPDKLLALPSPTMPTSDGVMVAGPNGVRPQTFGDVTAREEARIAADQAAAERQRLGLGEAQRIQDRAVPEQGPTDSPSSYVVADPINGDGPETVRLIKHSSGAVAIIRQDGDLIDISNMIKAGFSPERAIAASIGEDVSGKNVQTVSPNLSAQQTTTSTADVATPAAPIIGSDAKNGFQHGPDGTRYRTGIVSATGGVMLDVRYRNGGAGSFYVGVDGNMVDADSVNLVGDGASKIWKPTNEAQSTKVQELLRERAQLGLTDPKRKTLLAAIREIVTNTQPNSAPILSANGQPFTTEKAALLSIKAKRLDATVVPVNGGFGIQPKASNATNVPAEPGVQPTGRADLPAGDRQNLGDGSQRLSSGDNAGAVPAKPDAPASARPAGAVSAARPVEALTPAKPAKPKKPRKEPTLIAAIKAAGGLRSEFARDLTGETPRRANQMYPFAFRRDGVDLSTMVHNGLLDDFLPPHLRSEVFNAPDAPANPDEAIAYIEDAIRNGEAASMRSWDTQMALAQDAMTERQLESVADEISDEMSQAEIEHEIAVLAATNKELNEVANAEADQYAEQQIYDFGETAQAQSEDSSGDPGARTGDAQDQGRASEVERPSLELTGQTEGQIRSEEAQRAKQQAAQRARDNAPSPDDFTLTGSDRAADVGAARGQNEMAQTMTDRSNDVPFARANPTDAVEPPFSRADTPISNAVIKAVVPHINGFYFKAFATPAEAGRYLGFRIPQDARGVQIGRLIVLIEKNIPNQATAEFVIWHELFHAGFMVTHPRYGKEYQRLISDLINRNPNLARESANWRANYGEETVANSIKNGLTREQAEQRMQMLSVEEALADLAGQNVQINGIKNFIAKVQQLLRAIGFENLANWMEGKTDAEALAVILQTRDALTQEGAQFITNGIDEAVNQRAYHGSPHKFDKFSLDKIGTGEGAQAYGYGLYFASKKEIAEHYRSELTGSKLDRGAALLDRVLSDMKGDRQKTQKALEQMSEMPVELINHFTKSSFIDRHDANKTAKRAISLLNGEAKRWGQLYTVDIPEDSEMLDWDKPLSEQPEGVRKAIKRRMPDMAPFNGLDMGSNATLLDNRDGQADQTSSQPWILRTQSNNGTSNFGLTQKDVDRMLGSRDVDDLKGQQIYARLAAQKGSQQAASEYLNSMGIRGIKYLDGNSRTAKDGSHNYVIFDDKDVQITDTAFSRAKTEGMATKDVVGNNPESSADGKPNGDPRYRLVDTEGMTAAQAREAVQSRAEQLAKTLRDDGFTVELQHSGSASGPSSYLSVSDPQTGRFLTNQIRISNHSKGAFNSGGILAVATDAQMQEVVDAAKAMRAQGPTALFASQAENERKANEARIASAKKKLAAGKPLTKSEQEALGNQSGASADDITRSNAPNAFDTDERAADRAARVADVEEDYRLPNIGNAVPPDYVPRQASQKNVTIYRGVPDHVKNAAIRPGDWVSLDKKYAQQHGTGETGRSKVISMTVPADHVGWAGTDMNEWFYAPRSSNESPTPDSSGVAFSRKLPATIEVDSQQRPTTNSNGQPIHPTEEGVRNFWKWFADSKVVDDQGRPLVVYHGTGADISTFDNSKGPDRKNTKGVAWFSSSPNVANDFAGEQSGERVAGIQLGHSNVLPVYLKIESPVPEQSARGMAVGGGLERSEAADLKADGYDGIIWRESSFDLPDNDPRGYSREYDGKVYGEDIPFPDQYAVFDAAQIKSATGNAGQFSPDNADIRFSRKKQTEEDRRYFAAIESGDMETAQRIVDTAAVKAGYVSSEDYRMSHRAPNREDDRLDGIKSSGLVPDDYWTRPDWYQSSPEEWSAFGAVSDALRRNETRVASGKSGTAALTVYRAVPKSVKEDSFRNGDWVTPSEEYARREGQQINGGYRIIKLSANLSNLWWDGNSIAELGYDNGEEYAYKNTKNNRKLTQVVTKDDDGNIIPPSQRFNSRVSDARYSRTTPGDMLDPKASDAQAEYNSTEAVKNAGDTIKELTAKAMNAARDRRGMFLQVLGRRQILDIYGKDVPELARYNDILQRMEAEQNDGAQNADSIVQAWRKLTSKRPDVARAMAELMHDATLAAYDPDVSQPNNTERADIRKRWINLPDEAKQIYRQARDAYVEHFEKVKDALLARVERSGLDTKAKTRMLEQMRADFTKAMQGVYFPLARFGDYMVIVKNGKGETQAVSFAETQNQAAELRARLVRENPDSTVSQVQKRKEFSAERDGVSKGFMKDLVAVINEEQNGETREQMLDAVNQIYLSSIPDLSWAKSGIHRKGTPGYSQDAMRAFARNMFHGGYYLAKLNYGDQLQSSLMQMQADIDDKIKTDPGYSNIIAQNVVDEMNQRHKLVMNPNNTPVANFLTGLGFIFHMGLSPASAAVNLSQTALVAYPMMGAKFGFGKAMSALMKASGEAVKGKNDLLGQLTGDEKKAFEQAVKDGVIDLTMAHDLAGVSQGRAGTYNEKTDRVFRVASVMFHEAEKFNRGVTFLANFRLAKEAGQSNEAAAKTAAELTYASHFDYSANNRARIMQSPTARVLLLFKQYGQNMIYTLSRNTVKAFQGDKEAQKTLAGLLAMHGMFAGALGLPLVTTLLAAASAIGGSDDEPWDAQVALRNYLADVFGTEVGEVLAHGIFRAPGIKDVLGGDISGRVGLDSMLFRAPPDTLQGDKAYEAALMTAIGPVFGAGMNVAKGMHTAATGDIMRGVEEMMPKAIKDPLKALRYSKEGVVDKSRITLIDDTTVPEEVAQFLGFSPARSLEAYEGKAAIKEAETKLNQRRKELLNRYARARQDGDEAAVADVRDMIQSWNRANPTLAITGDTLLKSIQNRAKRQAEAENGVYLSKNKRGLSQLGDFAGVE